MFWADFKTWYMEMYWKFDNLFLITAKFFGITYHEFVLISLCVVWPIITLGSFALNWKLWRDLRRTLGTIETAHKI
jgi:hypothetical protein